SELLPKSPPLKMLRRERHGIKKFKIFDRSHLPDSLRSLPQNFVSGEVLNCRNPPERIAGKLHCLPEGRVNQLGSSPMRKRLN
ncbi:MAG: hypothetical protein NXI28_25030, partial [bacterium]|nr:hypothetical protein [bacterium]